MMRIVWMMMALLVSACGIQGDLYLPDEPHTKKPVDRSEAPITVDEELPDDL